MPLIIRSPLARADRDPAPDPESPTSCTGVFIGRGVSVLPALRELEAEEVDRTSVDPFIVEILFSPVKGYVCFGVRSRRAVRGDSNGRAS
jgi:hypothetical protein